MKGKNKLEAGLLRSQSVMNKMIVFNVFALFEIVHIYFTEQGYLYQKKGNL